MHTNEEYTPQQAAQHIGCRANHVLKLLYAGKLTSRRQGNRHFIPRGEVEAYATTRPSSDRITVSAAAKAIGCSSKFVRLLIAHGYLTALRGGHANRHWIGRNELSAYLLAYPTPPVIRQKQYREAKGGQRTEQPEYKAERLAHAMAAAERRGGQCLSSAYTHSHDPLEWRCAAGHEWAATFGSVVKLGRWCRECAGKKFFKL